MTVPNGRIEQSITDDTDNDTELMMTYERLVIHTAVQSF